MRMTAARKVIYLVWIVGLAVSLTGSQQPAFGGETASPPDLSEFRTVEKAITSHTSLADPKEDRASCYLGVQVVRDAQGKLAIVDVEADSPAAKAGVQRGDLVMQLAGEKVASPDAFRELLQGRSSGDEIKLGLVRKEKPLEVTATLGATSRPMKLGSQRAVLGIQLDEAEGGKGVVIGQVVPGSPASRANLKAGEVILKINGVSLSAPDRLRDFLTGKKPGEVVTLTLSRSDKTVDLKVELGAEQGQDARGFGGDRVGSYWKKDVYRLAVVAVEYPDVQHNEKIDLKEWQKAFFSKGSYTAKNATGQRVYGSLHDYYQEQSYGNLRVEGKVFDWVEVSKKRADYAEGSSFGNRPGLLGEALDKLLARDGQEALKDFDGICFLYAGGRYRTNRGGLYWPHMAGIRYQNKRWSYFIVPEGGSQMADLSVACHEFGHLLGLPDLYARPEQPGSIGIGAWCAMSQQAGNGRPQHFSAWCKEQLGWLKPAVLDPTVQQKLILSPVEDSPKECVKVLIQRDGSEYLLLENRRRKGFDESIPAEGLLIWHVVRNRPILEESHGIGGPAGPQVFASAIPYPSAANNSFTPFTIPSSRSQLGGGLKVHITNIRQLPDGRVTFFIGYEYL